MQTFTSGSAVENEPEQNLADDFEHWPNEPATRNDLRILATRIDRRFAKIDSRFNKIDARFDKIDSQFNKIDARFDKIDAQFAMVDARFTAQKSELQNAIRRDMFGFAAFLIFATTAIIGAINTFII
jgi:archaellum component FlaC